LWNIPPLQPCADSAASVESTLTSQTPVWTFSHPQKGGYDEIWTSSSSWPQDAYRPIYFNLAAVDGLEPIILYYMMKPTRNQQDDGISSLIPALMAEVVIDGFSGQSLDGNMHFCDNWLIQPWVDDKQIAVNITKIPTTRRGDTPNQTLPLWETQRSSDSLQCFDLCPISGRLCCSVIEDGYEIRVMDYVVPL
jgi:hypothetical protein